ncbi:MAG: alpha-glucosidase, partial [Cryptosporangiaceae bacterium]|nr:alpha-glucosidase [Cryptosporangiaceae bacterium]
MRRRTGITTSLLLGCALTLGGIAIVGAHPASAASSWTLAGPSASGPTATVTLSDSGSLAISAAKGTATVISSSPLGISTSSASFTSGLAFSTRTDRDVTESYTTVTGKQRTRSNTFKETTLAFTKGSAAMNLVVRVSADGIAYR